jgi:hypothetical protein
LQEDRLIPYLFRILDELIDEWDLVIVDTCFSALDALAKPEQFEVYWREYKRLELIGEGVELENFPDLEVLSHYGSCHVSQPKLVSALISRFDESPSQIANIMWSLRDPVFLPTLERHLTSIAPIKKYVPFSRSEIVEHDEWIEVGSAWLELRRQNWDSTMDSLRVDLLRFYQRPKLETPKESNASSNDYFIQRDRDQAELAARFLDHLPDKWSPGVSSSIDSSKMTAEIGAKIAFYLRKGGKIGRNDPCSCGSGKKFKKCCID